MALANRVHDLRAAVVHFIEAARAIEIEAIETALNRKAAKSDIPALALAIIASSVALTLTRERQLGVSSRHEEVMDMVERFFRKMDD